MAKVDLQAMRRQGMLGRDDPRAAISDLCDSLEKAEADLRVAQIGESFGKLAVKERDLERVRNDRLTADLAEARAAVGDLANALRLTVEYVGTEVLPPVPGWSWFDALSRHRPEMIPALSATAPPPGEGEGLVGPLVQRLPPKMRVRHNHMTRDLKAPGVCPACDARGDGK